MEVVELSRGEAMRLLASVPFGRVVFTRQALPAVRPVNHVVDDDFVVIRTRLTSRLTATVQADPEMVVAYEADDIDPIGHLGWSVEVTGIARQIREPSRVARYERLLQPWVAGAMGSVIAIEPALVTGLRLVHSAERTA